jgi:hypothetical protein
MKSCGCCGQLSPETSSCCAGCGTELKAATDEGTSSSPSIRRPPRPEAASIVLRTFDREEKGDMPWVVHRERYGVPPKDPATQP